MLKYRTYSFEHLEVWKEIRVLIVKIYTMTQTFPAEERFGLTSQMRRAVVSSGNNVAEGSSRESLRDQARFAEISYGSTLELLSDTMTSYDLGYISQDEMVDIRIHIDRVTAMLDGLRKSQLRRHTVRVRRRVFHRRPE